MPARQSGSPKQQCIGGISAFVDSIDSHIIPRMTRESKMKDIRTRRPCVVCALIVVIVYTIYQPALRFIRFSY